MTRHASRVPGTRHLPTGRDVLAGLSVALILIPASMAYAELAGLPGQRGLYVAAVAPLAAALFASSPYLQTGPVALTALLTLGALVPLADPMTADYIAQAGLLAVIVGVTRLAIGVFRSGWISYLLSQPMLNGFMSAAAVLIIASQLPGAVGIAQPEAGVLRGAVSTLGNIQSWHLPSVGLSVVTAMIVIGGRRLHPLVPGILIATAIGLVFSAVSSDAGPLVGDIHGSLPAFAFDLPWAAFPTLLLPGVVIAVVGFADVASISQVYAAKERQHWDPSREFVGQGVANLVAGLTGGFPVGGSFARSSVNYVAGAQTRWSGAITGLAVLAFLPVANFLSPLPRAVLAAIVISAVAGLVRIPAMAESWRIARPQGVVAWGTFAATLILAPHIEQAILFGVLASVAVHLWREMMSLRVVGSGDGEVLRLRPEGVLWFGSAPFLVQEVNERMATSPGAQRVVLDLSGLGRIDTTGALALRDLLEDVRKTGLEIVVRDVPDHAVGLLQSVGGFEANDT